MRIGCACGYDFHSATDDPSVKRRDYERQRRDKPRKPPIGAWSAQRSNEPVTFGTSVSHLRRKLAYDDWQDGGMGYNPLKTEVRAQTIALDGLRSTIGSARKQVAWFDAFDGDDVARRIAETETEVARFDDDLLNIRRAVADHRALAAGLRKPIYPAPGSRLVHSPWHLVVNIAFDVREVLKRKKELTRCLAEIEEAESRELDLAADRERALAGIDELHAEIARHSSFDRIAASGRLDELEVQASARSLALAKLTARATGLEQELEAPVAELLRCEQQLKELERRVEEARGFQSRLDATSDNKARYLIHLERERELGPLKLNDIIREANGEMRSLRRTIPKLEDRIRDIVRDRTRDVQRLVIDGSNVCHENTEFKGLWPLRAVLTHMVGKAEVIVFFDASIVRKLGLQSADQMVPMLRGVNYHVTAPGTPADETILDEAKDSGSYVLSNDVFRDFRDKAAVREDRILRHEIYGRTIKVKGLQLETVYPTSQ